MKKGIDKTAMDYKETYDVLVIGAGPAGSSAAKSAAENGASVLLLEKKTKIGVTVQCAEFVPFHLANEVELSPQHIASNVSTLNTYLPEGEVKSMASPGFVLHRSLFDKEMAVAACEAGADLRLGALVKGFSQDGILIRQGGAEFEIKGRVIIGADGPKSVVGSWMGSTNNSFLRAAQFEVVWPEDNLPETLRVYFNPAWELGYGWVFPKGRTANIGIGCLKEPASHLPRFLRMLGLGQNKVVARTGGLIPAGGPLACTRKGRFLLCGDAAGLTHSITGAGIMAAVASGKMAGKWAALAAINDDLEMLEGYEQEWQELLLPMLNRAVANRRYLSQYWTEDTAGFCQLIRKTWIAYPEYGRKKTIGG